MGEWVKLQASDGHELGADVARPVGEAVGALVLVQEIYGVNEHVRATCDGYAADGFVVIAPALFDRFEKDLELDYSAEGSKRAFELYPQLKMEWTLADVGAAYEFIAREGKAIGVIGYCYGGLTAWWAATRGPEYGMEPGCAVGYYAGGVGKFATEQTNCPVMLHFGANDDHIGKDQIEAVKQAHPDVQVFVYEGAGHAFNREPDPTKYNAEAAKLARARTVGFLKENLG